MDPEAEARGLDTVVRRSTFTRPPPPARRRSV